MVGQMINKYLVFSEHTAPRRCLSQFLKNSGSPRSELAGHQGGGEMETVEEKIFTTSVNVLFMAWYRDHWSLVIGQDLQVQLS